MAEDSGDRSTDDLETLLARIAQLQALLDEERAKRVQAEDALQKDRWDHHAHLPDQTPPPTEPDQRVQEEIRKRRQVKVAELSCGDVNFYREVVPKEMGCNRSSWCHSDGV